MSTVISWHTPRTVRRVAPSPSEERAERGSKIGCRHFGIPMQEVTSNLVGLSVKKDDDFPTFPVASWLRF